MKKSQVITKRPRLQCKKTAFCDVFLDLLKFNPKEHPVSLISGEFAKFPDTDPRTYKWVIEHIHVLRGYELVCNMDKGTFSLKSPYGRLLHVKSDQKPRSVSTQGRNYNIARILASCILKRDVTGSPYGICIDSNGIHVEDNDSRTKLCEILKKKLLESVRVELTTVYRSSGDALDVTGKGYFIENAVLYNSYGRPISVADSTGSVELRDVHGMRKRIGVGFVFFSAYPDIYKFKKGIHEEQDHIDGDFTNNAAWNFRPMTKVQNMLIKYSGVGDGRRSDGSHSKFANDFPNFPESYFKYPSSYRFFVRQYKNTNYYCINKGAFMLRDWRSGRFKYVAPLLGQHGYEEIGGIRAHKMMMIAFDQYEHTRGKHIMHLNDNRVDNSIKNLMMGTPVQNATIVHPIVVTLPDGSETKYDSICSAARGLGILPSMVQSNLKRQRDDIKFFSTNSKKNIKFSTRYV